jgi:hypothetical protein
MRQFKVIVVVAILSLFLVTSCEDQNKKHKKRATATAGLNIGETTILATADSGNSNLLLAQNATLAQSATIQSISFYVTTAAGNLRLGIYDATGPNAGPGTKKAETNSFVPVAGWNTANVIAPVLLAAGNYWLAYLPSSDGLGFERAAVAGTSAVYYAYPFTAMPGTFGTSLSSTTSHWSLYATLTTSGASATLSWLPSSGCSGVGTCDPASSATIYRGAASGQEVLLQTSPIASLPTCPAGVPGGSVCFIDSTVAVGTSYFYQVSETNSVGESQRSPETVLTQGSLSINPTSEAFGTVPIGSQSASQTATLTNNSGTAITFTSLTYSSSGSGTGINFLTTVTTCGGTLQNGSSCTIASAFKPTTVGALQGTLTISFTGVVAPPLTIALSGTGGATGVVAVSPTTINFGTVTLGSQSVGQPVQVTNNSGSIVTFTGNTFASTLGGSGTNFLMPSGSTCAATLANTSSCTLLEVFKPTVSGTLTDTLRIAFTGAAGSPLQIPLTGIAPTGVVAFAPPAHSYGSQNVGTVSAAQVETLTNNSGSTITFTGITYPTTGTATGTNFLTTSQTCGASLANNASCTISTSFKPALAGILSDSLKIAYTGANGSPIVIPLVGTGVAIVVTTPKTGDVIQLQVTGTTLKAYRNSVNLLTVIDHTFSSGSAGIAGKVVNANNVASGSQLVSAWSGGASVGLRTLASDSLSGSGAMSANWNVRQSTVDRSGTGVEVKNATANIRPYAQYSAITWPDDQWSQATLVINGSDSMIGPMVRSSGGNNFYYAGEDGTGIFIVVCLNGTCSRLGTAVLP